MDTNLIEKLLRNFKCFKGVYPSDMLPYQEHLPLNIIANTDPSSEPGTHWVCISIDEFGHGDYFDSFGRPPANLEIFSFLEAKCIKGWDYNRVAIQDISSTTCGHYCVLYVIFKCQGLNREDFISKFNVNTLFNDYRMKKIFGDYSLVRS